MASPESKKKPLNKMATTIGMQPLLADFEVDSVQSQDDESQGDGVASALLTENITP